MLLGMLILFLLLAMAGFGGYIEPIGVGLVLICVLVCVAMEQMMRLP